MYDVLLDSTGWWGIRRNAGFSLSYPRAPPRMTQDRTFETKKNSNVTCSGRCHTDYARGTPPVPNGALGPSLAPLAPLRQSTGAQGAGHTPTSTSQAIAGFPELTDCQSGTLPSSPVQCFAVTLRQSRATACCKSEGVVVTHSRVSSIDCGPASTGRAQRAELHVGLDRESTCAGGPGSWERTTSSQLNSIGPNNYL